MSKAITDKRDDRTPALAGAPGPSIRVEDEPTFARVCALCGAFCVVVGGVALYIGLFTAKTLPWPFTPFWMSLLLTVGCIALLFHAAYDRHVEFRRVYQFLGVLALIVGAVFCFLPYTAGGHGRAGDLLGPGVALLSLGLLFLLFTLRNETDAAARNWLQLLLLAAGSVLAIIGLFGGNLSRDFLAPVGLVLALIGLVYLLAFVGSRGTSDDLAHRAGLVIGAVGAIVFFVALWRSTARFPIVEIALILAVLVGVGPRLAVEEGFVAPEADAPGSRFSRGVNIARLVVLVLFLVAVGLAFGTNWIYPPNQPAWSDYVVPQGVLLMGMGLIYVCTSYLICSDAPLAVLTRRELAAFVYSPVAYFLLFGSSVFAAWSFWLFALPLYYSRELGPMFEPIVKNYMGGNNFLAVICAIGVVPALTMRLFSEEKRSGTLEVLLTAPVSDFAVLMSKFLAALLMFLLVWLPFGVYLIALRLGAGKDFDYRPLLSFFVALVFSGANFVGMGLFFSCLTRNQIVSFILSLIGMLTFFCIYFGRLLIQIKDPGSVWESVLQHMSYHDLWSTAMEGRLQPRFLVFPATLAVLWLFMTAKVLEIRKWS